MLACKSDLQKFVGVLRIYGTKVRLIEGNAKCRILKLTYEGTLRQVFVYQYMYKQYTYSHREGGEVETERRLEG
jgi:hypothetical protein